MHLSNVRTDRQTDRQTKQKLCLPGETGKISLNRPAFKGAAPPIYEGLSPARKKSQQQQRIDLQYVDPTDGGCNRAEEGERRQEEGDKRKEAGDRRLQRN